MSVTHAKVATTPGDNSEVDFDDWNAAHVVSLDASNVTMTIRAAAGVPAGAPSGSELPVAVDTTATSGGLYYWTGAAWVQISVIPPVVTPD